MTNDDLMLLKGLDQSLQVDGDWVMEKIDEILKQSFEKKDVYIALNVCRQLVAVGQVSGLGLARALYYIKKNWEVYNIEESPDEIIFDYIGKHKHTVERYINIWALFDKDTIPPEHRETFQTGNIGLMIPIANAVAQGYEIEPETWDKLAEAPDQSTVAKIVREDVRHAEPKKGSLQLYLDTEGSIWAFYNNERFFVGNLVIESEEESVQKAIERIIRLSGILEG